MHRTATRRIALLLLMINCTALSAFNVTAQVLPGGNSSTLNDGRTPNGALYRSFVPGWGQIYNRQYEKLPFLYGGLAGIGYLAVWYNGSYQDYNDAYHYKVYEEQVDAGLIEENPNEHLKDSYDEIAAEIGPVSSSPLKAQRDVYRRNRDLSRMGIVAVYALSILDAYVSAHLLDFNVDEDLSIRVMPVPTGVGFKASYTLF
jgi:Family of unknown function (DUF5683)